MSKGSRNRTANHKAYAENYERIFRNDYKGYGVVEHKPGCKAYWWTAETVHNIKEIMLKYLFEAKNA